MVTALGEDEGELESPAVLVTVPPGLLPLPGTMVGASGSENREGSCIQAAFEIGELYE
jgi:hypothetical protein